MRLAVVAGVTRWSVRLGSGFLDIGLGGVPGISCGAKFEESTPREFIGQDGSVPDLFMLRLGSAVRSPAANNSSFDLNSKKRS